MSNPNPAFITVSASTGPYLYRLAAPGAPSQPVQTGNLVYPANFGFYILNIDNTPQNPPVTIPFASASTLAVVGPNLTGSGETGSGKTGA